MTPPTGARAFHVGRVGALAAALGAGVVLAGTAVAAADTGSTDRGPTASRAARTPVRPAPAAGTATRSSLFAGKPKLDYDAATNTQGPGGVITGALNGSQRNGYPLSYTVPTPPGKGTATVGVDGGFTYTPTPEFAALGGTDTFAVTADDLPGNPRHLHGLAALTPTGGHTVTQSVTVLENPGAPLPPSVLATTDQLAAERVSTRLAGSPAVHIAGLILKAGWIQAARNNFGSVGGPDSANVARLDEAVTEYATQAALEVQLLNSADPKVIQQVSPPHDWYQQSFAGSRIWYDNPDTIYRFIGVNTASSYVITGRFDGSIPADTNFSVLTGLNGVTSSNLNGRDLVLSPDGSFTITASSAPAAPGQTNHLQLAPGTTLITTRNTLADWNSEEPMSLSVSKVSGPPPSLFSQVGGFAIPGIGPAVAASPVLTSLVSLIPPLPRARGIQAFETAAIMLLLGISGEDKYMAVATTDPKTGQLRAPNVLSEPGSNAEFLATQLQSAGYFQLADDQALVVTVDPGNARYFNVPVTDDWTITGNYWDEQTSLNRSQSAMNPDGTYTIVIAKTDPGVANWVSTGGLNQGTVSIRFQDPDTSSVKAPTVQSQVVPIGELNSVLPVGTVYVTPGQRQAQITARQLGYNRRYAPYPQA